MSGINLMQPVCCKQCSNASIGFENVYVNVVLNKATYCPSCNKTDVQNQSVFFCSLRCFNAYMADFFRHGLEKNPGITWVV